MIAVALTLVAGASCGGDQSSSADRHIAQESVLRLRDLPPGADRKHSPDRDDDCNPRQRFEGRANAVIDAPRYGIGNTSFSHAVAIFESDAAAESAQRDFTSDDNNQCVLAEMEREALEQTGRTTHGRSTGLRARPPKGFDATAARFAITTAPGERRYFDTVTLRRGRGIVVVGCYSPRHPSSLKLRDRLARVAARRLSVALDEAERR